MKSDRLIEIIDFAIEREKEAVLFYEHLKERQQFSNQHDMLDELAEMELDHVRVLEKIKDEDLSEINVPDVNSLNLSEYLEPVDDLKNLSYPDVLRLAMKREEKAERLYAEMADKSKDEPIVYKLFKRLEAEEKKHKLDFETMYDEEVFSEN
jgi:rubrerythrin